MLICIDKWGTAIRAVKQQLKQALSHRQKQYIIDSGRVAAAVLVPIYSKQGQYYILFTRRTDKVKEHKGEISFPGGAYQEGDGTLVGTALRECAEEIGLMSDKVEVLGELDDMVTAVSNYIVTPLVGLIPWPYLFKMDEEEVEEIIEVPIRALLDKGCLEQKTEIIEGVEDTLLFYHYQDRVIWGATAQILKQFLDIFGHVME